MQQMLIDHLLGSRSVACASGLAPSTDEMTCWISTTRSLDWAIWDIARRLANYRLPVKFAVIRQDHLGVAAANRKQADRDEVRLDAFRLLERMEEDITDPAEKKRVEEAKRRTKQSQETLYYGRVFSSSIEANLLWTIEVQLIL